MLVFEGGVLKFVDGVVLKLIFGQKNHSDF